MLEDLGPLAVRWYMHTTTLADPYFEGRIAGSEGMVRAGEYIVFHFKRYGLEPAFPEGDGDEWSSYFQPFEIKIFFQQAMNQLVFFNRSKSSSAAARAPRRSSRRR